MSADAYVSSSRLRPPSNLTSSILPARRDGQHRHLFSATSAGHYRGWRGEDREGDPALAGGQVDSDSYEPGQDGASEGHEQPEWIDLDRFEDWDRPTLETLCPTIRIPFEEHLFPIAVADDGESLPSEMHPSHPYGNLHEPSLPYTSRFKLPHRRGLAFQSPEDADAKGSEGEDVSLPVHLSLRAREMFAPNPPTWPFKRFGPGPGGPNALQHAESKRPWKPYRPVWADMGLEELLPLGAKVKDGLSAHALQGERADLPHEEEGDANMEAVLQEIKEFDVLLQSGEEGGNGAGKGKKKRRVQEEWKWGQPARQG